jgi:hypothetical protein
VTGVARFSTLYGEIRFPELSQPSAGIQVGVKERGPFFERRFPTFSICFPNFFSKLIFVLKIKKFFFLVKFLKFCYLNLKK